MWKLIVGFVVFAALALGLLFKGGDIDMSGERHGEQAHAPAADAAPAAPVVSASAAPAASMAASAASK